MSNYSDAVDRHYSFLEAEFGLSRSHEVGPVSETVSYAGDPVSVVVHRELRDEYLTARLVASFGAPPDLATMASVPLQSLAEGLAGSIDLAGMAEEPAEVDRLLARQAAAIRPFLRRALDGDFADFEAHVIRMRARHPDWPLLDWWANPIFTRWGPPSGRSPK